MLKTIIEKRNALLSFALQKKLVLIMLSRRNIRIKVMQTIFEQQLQFEKTSSIDALNYFYKKLAQTSKSFTGITNLIISVSEYVLVYSNKKTSKYITTAEDLNINTIISQHPILQTIKNNPAYIQALKDYNLSNFFTPEVIKRCFKILINTDAYNEYINTISDVSEEEATQKHKEILRYIYTEIVMQDEDVIEILEENFINWEDDEEIMFTWFDYLIEKPHKMYFSYNFNSEKILFAKELIETYFNKKEQVYELIIPKLNNWDIERVAQLDTIILHLGICEMLFFPNIPVKVTINEYIDISKMYSTPQSGQFVNGVLDKIHIMLFNENKIRKIEFKNKKDA